MYCSYKNLFRIKWKIYSIGDKALPRPIPLDGLGIFLLFLLPAYYAGIPLSEMLGQARAATALALDGLLTYMVLQYDPQGRPFFIYCRDILAYLIHPSRQDLNGIEVPAARHEALAWSAYAIEE